MPDRERAWRCLVCGFVHRGVEPPESCPVCGAGREDFEPVEEDSPSSGDSKAPAVKGAGVVVIGAGIAGIAAVESLLAASPATEITLISAETELPYYRLNLTRYLAGEVQRESLPIHPADWYQERNIRLLLGEEVRSLDLEGHAVELGNGKRISFDKLLLAAGAHPFIPPIPGSDRERVTTLRTVEDADYLLKACDSGARCVCIGGGILGLETAGALARRGAKVTLLESHGWLLPRQLNERAGEILGDHARRMGITLRNKAKTREILAEAGVSGVLLEDGSTIPADLVVIATGVRANSTLAQKAGLEVQRGVVVDSRLATSHPDVLAAGDVAEHKGVVYGLWTASHAQGTIAGKNLAGGSAEFGGLPRSNTLKVLGLDMFSIGQIMPEDASFRVFEQEAEGGYSRFVFHENLLVGAILLGDMRLMPAAKKAVEDKRDCSSLLRGAPTAGAVIEYFGGAAVGGSRSAAASRKPSAAPGTEPGAGQGAASSYVCGVCGYVYDERKEGRNWRDLPDDWACPACGAPKASFMPVGGGGERPLPAASDKVSRAHRIAGYIFLAIYVVLAWQMAPRLWSYQIEFPARTVAHMSLGMAIGVILFLKIAIVRFFRRLDAPLVPALGTSLLVASTVLIGIAVPPAFREALATSRLFDEENCERVEALLLQAGLDEAASARLASRQSLRAGQEVLRRQCVKCHDLRTVLAQPRTPSAWRQTVRRMADRTTLLDPLDEEKQWQVTAYLVALSPQLQQSAQQMRRQEERRAETKQAAATMAGGGVEPAAYDAAEAKRLFETRCSECHKLTLVESNPPDSADAARGLVVRMVDEGLTASEDELALIVRYLTETYAK
ncbi:MAG: FAD-dependent oxidoreductase [Thermoguttaceae bacterium]|jgi:nitrite reductase (NADH) large subunit